MGTRQAGGGMEREGVDPEGISMHQYPIPVPPLSLFLTLLCASKMAGADPKRLIQAAECAPD